jgi:hypothetical protein
MMPYQSCQKLAVSHLPAEGEGIESLQPPDRLRLVPGRHPPGDDLHFLEITLHKSLELPHAPAELGVGEFRRLGRDFPHCRDLAGVGRGELRPQREHRLDLGPEIDDLDLDRRGVLLQLRGPLRRGALHATEQVLPRNHQILGHLLPLLHGRDQVAHRAEQGFLLVDGVGKLVGEIIERREPRHGGGGGQAFLLHQDVELAGPDAGQVARDGAVGRHLLAVEVHILQAGQPVNGQVGVVHRDETDGVLEDREGDQSQHDDRDRGVALEDVFDDLIAGHPEKPAAPLAEQHLTGGQSGERRIFSGGGHGGRWTQHRICRRGRSTGAGYGCVTKRDLEAGLMPSSRSLALKLPPREVVADFHIGDRRRYGNRRPPTALFRV